MVRQAQAALDHALLQLSYTVVHAPMDGIVAKVDQIQVGDHVNAATPLFALMSGSDMWVEANFKETDLTYMRPGQHATFSVDAYPGRTFTGQVLSTSPGTGSSFSLLPPENSSGNWVKVVQRLPVRLSIDDNGRRAAGRGHERGSERGHRTSPFAGILGLTRCRDRPEDGFEETARDEGVGATEALPPPAPPSGRVRFHGLITVSVMLATIMQALDTTIANVALPRMQGTLSATQDEMGWVLTSYIVAAAITIPLTGWLAGEFGRRRVFLVSIFVFTVASALCGVATSLRQIVLFRFLQGVGGAALVPLSQAVLFDINPPKDFGRAMSIWGIGVTMGPILGPALGRLADRQLFLALGVLHQPADRRAGLCRPVLHHARKPQRASPRASISWASPASVSPSPRCR